MRPTAHTCLALLVLSPLALGGCSDQGQEARKNGVGMANPASEYCEKQGGKVLIEKNRQGAERGVCHLPDGTRIDEWELFRRDNPTQPK